MSNIVACYKWVINESEINFNKDLSLDTSAAHYKISDYDRNAIQLAVNIAKETGAKPLGLSCGGQEVQKSFKDALSRNLDEAYWVDITNVKNNDSVSTAAALAGGIKKIGDVDFVICADASSDVYGRQTGARIAAQLDVPYVGLVCEAHLEGNKLVCTRKLDEELETVSVSAPAVIAILPEAVTPIVPGLKALVAAGKKPNHKISAADLEIVPQSKSDVVEDKAYVMVRKNIILEAESMSDKVSELFSLLRKDGVL